MDSPINQQFEQSPVDQDHYGVIRSTVKRVLAEWAQEFDYSGVRVLDVAPESHEGARGVFESALVETLDIDRSSRATHIADLCACNCASIVGGQYDLVICTEVLEHTRQPWLATRELHRLVKPGGVVALTTPFNFRIHGPSPDCWRFTEDGLHSLLEIFRTVQVTAVEDPGRPRMPIQYISVARKAEDARSVCWMPEPEPQT